MSDRSDAKSPEFSRTWPIDALPEGPVGAEADAGERAALARRYDVPEVRSLRFRATVRPWRGGAIVEGEVEAGLVQTCVITLEPVETELRDRFVRRFLPEDRLGGYDPGDLDAPDPLPDALDLGEVAAEAAALAIDPYPRKPGATFEGRVVAPPGAEPLDDEAARPFAGLAALKNGKRR